MKKKTIIRLSITLIVIAALALWINSRWSAWFHNEADSLCTAVRTRTSTTHFRR